jgi:hypothetical protein
MSRFRMVDPSGTSWTEAPGTATLDEVLRAI